VSTLPALPHPPGRGSIRDTDWSLALAFAGTVCGCPPAAPEEVAPPHPPALAPAPPFDGLIEALGTGGTWPASVETVALELEGRVHRIDESARKSWRTHRLAGYAPEEDCDAQGALGHLLVEPLLAAATRRGAARRVEGECVEVFDDPGRWSAASRIFRTCFDAGRVARIAVRTASVAPVAPAPTPILAAPPPAVGPASRFDVVLVAEDDTLNLRERPDPKSPVLATLAPDAKGLAATGRTESGWRELTVGERTGWVNERYLTEHATAFATDARVLALLQTFAAALRTGADPTPLVARRGLYRAHFAPPLHVPRAAIAERLADPARLLLEGPACGERCVERTFGELLAHPFLTTFWDPERTLSFDEWRAGGNASASPPAELEGFHFVTIFDPGDYPCLGLDWRTAAVFFEYEDGAPRIVGLAEDEWSP